MNKLLVITMLMFAASSWSIEEGTGQDRLIRLLEELKKEQVKTTLINEEREQRFSEGNRKTTQKLRDNRATLAAARKKTEQLQKQYERNEALIKEKQGQLDQKSSNLQALQGLFSQAVHEISPLLRDSLISGQKPERRVILEKIAQNDLLPNIEKIEKLWLTTLEEIAESARITQFKAKIITVNGEEVERLVTRLGSFTAFHGNTFLRYRAEEGRFIEVFPQPPHYLRRAAKKIGKESSGEVIAAPIDPTRGALYATLARVPSTYERTKQAGIIGLLTILLGLIGLGVAGGRLLFLSRTKRAMESQYSDNSDNNDNPMARLLATHCAHQQSSSESLEYQLEQCVLKEIPLLKRGISILALFAAVAPLLGLLGTVTGIIETFQAITLFGSGDPSVLSSGISKALVTTVIGLVVAIPLLFLHALLGERSDQLIQVLDEKTMEFVSARMRQL